LQEEWEVRLMAHAFYRLKIDTMAITAIFPYRQQLIVIPMGAILMADVDDMRIGGDVQVEWAGKRFTMFATDLKDRGEEV
jgi:hypothetical protein